jgi:hypothetical protein
MNHYQLLTLLAQEHIQELNEQASRHRLATALRRGRRKLWPESHVPRRRGTPESHREVAAPSASRNAGRLAPCEVLPRVAGPVR